MFADDTVFCGKWRKLVTEVQGGQSKYSISGEDAKRETMMQEIEGAGGNWRRGWPGPPLERKAKSHDGELLKLVFKVSDDLENS